MILTRRHLLATTTALVATSWLRPALAAAPIIIGELTSYQRLPAFTTPYRNGWMMAVEQINANGGVLNNRKLLVISRDDQGTPADSQIVADQLVAEDKAIMLMGSSFAHIADALAQYANKRPVPFLAIQPLTDHLVPEQIKRNTDPNPGASFLLRPSLVTQAAVLAEQAAALPAKRWAIIAPNYEFGKIVAATFQANLSALRPDVEFVAMEWPLLNSIDAPETVTNLLAAAPDAIFNACFGPDLTALFQEGLTRALFIRRPFVSLLTGEPEYLADLRKILVGDFELYGPSQFITTGYPVTTIKTPEHTAFRDAYLARYAEEPKMASVLGYSAIQAIVTALRESKTFDTADIIKTMNDMNFNTPFGPVTLRQRDHQSTMGVFVGNIGVTDNQITMIDGTYKDGTQYLPTDQSSLNR